MYDVARVPHHAREAGQNGGAPPMTSTGIEVPSHSFALLWLLLLFHNPHFSLSLILDLPGLGEKGCVGGEHGELPGLRRPFPDWRRGWKFN